jgi:hypothetical protein
MPYIHTNRGVMFTNPAAYKLRVRQTPFEVLACLAILMSLFFPAALPRDPSAITEELLERHKMWGS